jgi:leucine-rich repeat-containing protein 16
VYKIVRSLTASHINICIVHVFSGNLMGDMGARMLSKALQINKKLTSVYWDHNGTSATGFQYIATALEKLAYAHTY